MSADQQHPGLLRTAKHHAMALTLRAALRTVERLSSRHHIALDYPPTSANRPRYGHGKPEHQRVKDILASRDAAYYSEQYLLAACLLGGSRYIVPVLPCYYTSRHADLKQVLAPLWRQSHFAGVDPSGSSFWFVQSDRAS